MVSREPLLAPRAEPACPLSDRVARGAHERDQKMYIVQREQTHAEHLVRDEQVPDVRAAEPAACRAVAALVERPLVGAELRALDVDPAVGGEGGAVPAHARGGHA